MFNAENVSEADNGIPFVGCTVECVSHFVTVLAFLEDKKEEDRFSTELVTIWVVWDDGGKVVEANSFSSWVIFADKDACDISDMLENVLVVAAVLITRGREIVVSFWETETMSIVACLELFSL